MIKKNILINSTYLSIRRKDKKSETRYKKSVQVIPEHFCVLSDIFSASRSSYLRL